MEAPDLGRHGTRGLVLRCRDKYVAVRIRPSQFQAIVGRTVKMMAEALWTELRGAKSNQPQFQEMVQRLKEPEFDWETYRAWEDSRDQERKEFVEAAVRQIGRLEERQREGGVSSKDEPTDLQSLQSGL